MSLRFSPFSGSDSSVKVKVVGVSTTVALDGASTPTSTGGSERAVPPHFTIQKFSLE